MDTIIYRDSKKIDLDLSKKLFKYIYINLDLYEVHEIIKEFEPEYLYFYGEGNNEPLNEWLALDYVDRSGKTFIDKFLKEGSKILSKEEKKILKGRNQSHVSLFKIIKFDGEKVHVEDVLMKKDFILLEPYLSHLMEEGDYIFSRIGKTLDIYTFISEIKHLPLSSKYDFVRFVLLDYNLKIEYYGNLSIKDYLKKFTLNIHKIYDRIIYGISSSDNPHDLKTFNNFESYLKLNGKKDIELHFNNAYNFVNFQSNGTNLEFFNFDTFLISAIKNGDISLRGDFLFYIESLKLYFLFLNESCKPSKISKERPYAWALSKISGICESPFKYLKKINLYNKNFIINNEFCFLIKHFFTRKAFDLTVDFDSFLSYIEITPIKLTRKKSKINRRNLLELNSTFINTTDPKLKAPNQRNFINIDLFYDLAIGLKLIKVSNNNLFIGEEALNYFSLEYNEKYVFLFKHILNTVFKRNRDNIRTSKKILFNKLSGMSLTKEYYNSYFLVEGKDIFSKYYHYLQLLGLINLNLESNNSISITGFGKKISNYLNCNIYSNNKKLINLKDFIE